MTLKDGNKKITPFLLYIFFFWKDVFSPLTGETASGLRAEIILSWCRLDR